MGTATNAAADGGVCGVAIRKRGRESFSLAPPLKGLACIT